LCFDLGFGARDFSPVIVVRWQTMTVGFPEFNEGRLATKRPAFVNLAPPTAGTVSVTPSDRGIYRRFFKRLFDVTAILMAAPVVLPIIIVAAILVARDGANPFYTQLRVGKGGRWFWMWKLRSMVHDADARMAGYLESNPVARAEWETTQKLKEDPRVTKIGRFLRKSSLDELPQLWNVLIGDMSLVGPRPMMISQQHLYPGKAYYALRPGITGHWQTAGRNRTSFEARADYDTAYEEELSFATDLNLLIETVGVVVKGTGY
jgi:exopolysaccharide production protein ExoY